MLNFNLKMVI